MYSDLILELYKHPLHRGVLKKHTHSAREFNPSCGDKITMQFLVKDGFVKDAMFDGEGCAISTASASLLLDHVIGKKVDDLLQLKGADMTKLIQIPISAGRTKCLLLPLVVLQKSLKS